MLRFVPTALVVGVPYWSVGLPYIFIHPVDYQIAPPARHFVLKTEENLVGRKRLPLQFPGLALPY